MTASQVALAYLVASVLFILALKGLSIAEPGAPRQSVRHRRHGHSGGHHAGADAQLALILVGIAIGGASARWSRDACR